MIGSNLISRWQLVYVASAEKVMKEVDQLFFDRSLFVIDGAVLPEVLECSKVEENYDLATL